MRTSPKTIALIYFVMGVLFVYVAILNASDSGWNFLTVLFAIFATLDFTVGIRLMRTHLKNKKKKKE
ncbi:YdiK family protein [Virgibacillus flavescens]|uniref:YdiK family protein n=1 Tax=Virgibacillus flavescens TaxID=1611422 RepID=UPI003D32A50E